MLLLPGSMLALATVVLTVALVVVSKEQRQGQRMLLTTFRDWLDERFDSIIGLCAKGCAVVGISIRYVVHQLRAGLARLIAPRPRQRKAHTKMQFEKTDNHLSSMHDHKSDTALTVAQKKKLRSKKLEERF